MINYDLFGKVSLPAVKNLRIPYMGSKNKISLQLFEKMLEIKPNAKYFYDLFGGGASMSFTALQLGLKVHYNEKQKSMVEFVDYIIKRIKNKEKGNYGLFPDDFYNFITKQEFKNLKNENSVKGQFARICYSFGNRGVTYAFGEIEKEKHLTHNIVMFCCEKSLAELNSLKNTNFILSEKKTWNERRLDFLSQIASYKREEDYLRILTNLINLQKLEELKKLEQLERLEAIKRFERFKTTSLDFQDVKIETPIDETIIYLDPPYRGTATYTENTIFQDVDNYFLNSPYDCFLSEYNAPFEPVLSINKRSLLSPTGHFKTAIEKLFYNRK